MNVEAIREHCLKKKQVTESFPFSEFNDGVLVFKVAEKKTVMMLNIKTMLLRGKFTEQEIRTMHGMLRALAESDNQA